MIKLFYWKNSMIFSSCIDVRILHFGAVCHSRTWACMQGHISEIQFFQKRCKCPMLKNMSSKNKLGGMNLKVQGLIKRQDVWPKDLVIVRPQNLKNTFDEYYYFFCSHTAFDEYYYFFCSHTAFDEYHYFFCSHTAFDEYHYFFCSHTAFNEYYYFFCSHIAFNEYYYFFCSHTAFNEYYNFFCSHTAFINSAFWLNIKIVDQDISNWWPITDIACHSALMRIPYT